MNTLIKVLVSHSSPININFEFLKSAIRYDVKFKFMNLYWNFPFGVLGFRFVCVFEGLWTYLYLRGWFKFQIGICENCLNVHNIVDMSSKNIVAIGNLIGIVLKPMILVTDHVTT